VVPRRSKAEALGLAQRLKQGILVGTLVGFGALGGLVMTHEARSTTTSAAGIDTSSSTSSAGGFFTQQGGSSFGSNGNTSAVSGSHSS
jgi:hypothetical protein